MELTRSFRIEIHVEESIVHTHHWFSPSFNFVTRIMTQFQCCSKGPRTFTSERRRADLIAFHLKRISYIPEFSENPPWVAIRKMGVSWCEVWPQITARALIRKVKPNRWAYNWKAYTSTTCVSEPFPWLYQPDRGSRTFSRYLLVQNHTGCETIDTGH